MAGMPADPLRATVVETGPAAVIAVSVRLHCQDGSVRIDTLAWHPMHPSPTSNAVHKAWDSLFRLLLAIYQLLGF
jgi:hypothetical protein